MVLEGAAMDDEYNPAEDALWTLAMAAAWAMWRDIKMVGAARSLSMAGVAAVEYETDAKDQILTWNKAWSEIKAMALAGNLPVEMVDQRTLEPRQPSQAEWKWMALDHDSDFSDRFWFRPESGIQEAAPRFRSATVGRDAVLQLWRPKARTEVTPSTDPNLDKLLFAAKVSESSLRTWCKEQVAMCVAGDLRPPSVAEIYRRAKSKFGDVSREQVRKAWVAARRPEWAKPGPRGPRKSGQK
jgi:hypothetical protein